MKIAQLHPYPPEYEDQIPVLPGGAAQGGGETSSFRYALALSEAGHDVTYYVARYPGITKKEVSVTNNFRIVYLNTTFKNMGPAFSFKLFFKLLFGKYDVIESNQIPTMFSLTGAFAGFLSRTPFFITFHGRLPYAWPDRLVGRIASGMSKGVTVQNQYAYDLVKGFVPNSKLIMIPHGIDEALFSRKKADKKLIKKYAPKGEVVVLFVGRLINAKGIDVLIDAVDQCIKNGMQVSLLIAGSGELKDDLAQQARELNITKNVYFLGPIKQEELPDYYSISSVFVLPSAYHLKDGTSIPNVSENFGLVLAEAMSCEVPIIASRVGGIPQWIDEGKTGLLFEERNASELSMLIKKVVAWTPVERRKVTQAAKHVIDTKYTWSAIIKNDFEPLFRKHHR